MTFSSEQQATMSNGRGRLTTTPPMPLYEIQDILAQRPYHELKIIQRHIRQLQNQNSPLLRLPAELRNYIFELVIEYHMRCDLNKVFVDHTFWWRLDEVNMAVGAVRGQGQAHRTARDLSKVPSLFGVCRQIRSESRSLYYGKFVAVERYDVETKSWQNVHFNEVVPLLLRPRRRSNFMTLQATKDEAELHTTPQEEYVPPQLYVLHPTPHSRRSKLGMDTSYCAFEGFPISLSTGLTARVFSRLRVRGRG
ncbi:hypothetical protein LTR37_014542 [Vermiconidia calcicola]|uniref:Uncharacterized protein n=1 Tax=Vermiconidia calcicola TaxID=1690605 RepID=A0ACC3MTC1_9PEZI|nr:hypothetical protein LTR37_014542 [Vermiconidia calcicola]